MPYNQVDVVDFCLSVSGRCCLDGSSIHQPIFCCSSHSPESRHLLPSSPPHSSPKISLFLLPFTFPCSIIFSSVWCLFVCFEILSSSVMDWIVLCSVCDTRNTFLYHLFSNALMLFLCSCSWSTFVAVGNTHVPYST